MEQTPSLRSSSIRETSSRLRIPEPAVHETIQRIVESCKDDLRISQYADINYATKRFEKDKWVITEPLGGARVGWLVFTPKCPAVWMEDTCKTVFTIPCRVGSSIYTKSTVFVASLNKSTSQLRVEDCWMYEGVNLVENQFSKRWNKVLDFFSKKFFEDSMIQQNLKIFPCEFFSLVGFHWNQPPAFVIAQGERASRRLRVQLRASNPNAPLAPIDKKPQKVIPKLVEDEDSDTSSTTASLHEEVPSDAPPGVAKAVPHESYPDTYYLWVDGKKKGYAAVQDLALSKKLKSVHQQKEILVDIAWNEDFKMYEILSLHQTE
jgi:hypothetical protein